MSMLTKEFLDGFTSAIGKVGYKQTSPASIIEHTKGELATIEAKLNKARRLGVGNLSILENKRAEVAVRLRSLTEGGKAPSNDEWEKDSAAVKASKDPKFISKMIDKWGERGGAWLNHPALKEEEECDDESDKEEEEELDELSTDKMRDYASAALQDKDKSKADKRWKYVSKAMKKVGDKEAQDANDLKFTREAAKLDKVDKDELDGDYEDREDKDIDNDGDEDDSDEYLHNRRKAISKSMDEQIIFEGLKLNKDNPVTHDAESAEFAKMYVKGLKGDYTPGGPSAADEKATNEFFSKFKVNQSKSGYAGSGTAEYINVKTGDVYLVKKSSNGNGFYGTDHKITKAPKSDQIDELSRETLASYHKKARETSNPLGLKKQKAEKQLNDRIRSGKSVDDYTPKDKLTPDEEMLLKKRDAGARMAIKKINKIDNI